MTCPSPFPEELALATNMEAVLSSLRDYIGVHQCITDDSGVIIDTELVWWNSGYEQIRVTPVVERQTMMSTYFEPEIARQYVREAWQHQKSRQVFELNEDTFDRYRPPGILVRIEVTWLRLGNLILEIGSDLSEMTALEIELATQRQAYNDATRESVLFAERSRIGRDLHDSIIQSLYAISLNIRSGLDSEAASLAIGDVISNIRSAIFEIAPTTRPPVKETIEEVVQLFGPAWQHSPICNIRVTRELPDDILDDVQNVIREGLSNAARHAKANQVRVDVDVSDTEVTIRIEDDGIGPNGISRRKAGTLSLAHRAALRNGAFQIADGDTGGTVLTWSCPIE